MSKPRTTYTKLAKPKTAYTKLVEPKTSYTSSANAVLAVLLSDLTVRLDSLVVYLNGFTTATSPNTLNSKPLTTYTAV